MTGKQAICPEQGGMRTANRFSTGNSLYRNTYYTVVGIFVLIVLTFIRWKDVIKRVEFDDIYSNTIANLLVGIVKAPPFSKVIETRIFRSRIEENDFPTSRVNLNDTYQARKSRNRSNQQCAKTYPILSSWKIDNREFQPFNCGYSRFQFQNISNCLQNRKIHTMGNSIARQFAFHIVNMFEGHISKTRQEEKQICTKYPTSEHPSCIFNLPNNLKVYNSWILDYDTYLGPEQANKESPLKDREADICAKHDNFEKCLQQLGLTESNERDILLFNMGIGFALWDPVNVTDIYSWQQKRVESFIEKVNKVFNGTVVYMNISPMKTNDIYQRAQSVNKAISETILTKTDWLVYDIWSVNEPVLWNTTYYSDAYHFPGFLTAVGWDIILSSIC